MLCDAEGLVRSPCAPSSPVAYGRLISRACDDASMRGVNITLSMSGGLLSFGIRQKMVLVLLAVMIIALSTSGWLTLRQQSEDVLHETQRHAEDITRYVSKSVAMGVIGYDYHGIQFLLDEILGSKDIVYARVTNGLGNTMAEAGVLSPDQSNELIFESPIVFDGQVVGSLEIGLDNAHITQRLAEQRYAIIAREASIIILVALGEFLALSYLIMRPMGIVSESLAKGVDERGGIVQDIPIKSRDEFGMLASLFNLMREQLNEANTRLQTRVESADAKLRETNERLQQQSDELKHINIELRQLSVTDALTGLYNRRHFEAVMDMEFSFYLRHEEQVSLLVIDIDLFKNINDNFGHRTGDQVIIELARMLKENLRKSDTICRIGGEEYVAICRRIGKEDAIALANKVRLIVEKYSMATDIEDLRFTISIGIDTLAGKHVLNGADEFFGRADRALYHSKKHGRNLVTHYTDMEVTQETAEKSTRETGG